MTPIVSHTMRDVLAVPDALTLNNVAFLKHPRWRHGSTRRYGNKALAYSLALDRSFVFSWKRYSKEAIRQQAMAMRDCGRPVRQETSGGEFVLVLNHPLSIVAEVQLPGGRRYNSGTAANILRKIA